MKFFDLEFSMSWSAFFTYIFIATITVSIFIFFEYTQYQKQEAQERALLEQIQVRQFISPDEVSTPFIKELILQNHELQNNLLRLNEQQIKWIHDIKLPLATLQLFIQNNKESLSMNNRKTLELIALNFDQLIEQKLMLDKVISNIDDLIIEPVELSPLIIGVIRKLAPLLQMKQITVDFSAEKDLVVISDKKSLRYCFEQIMSNAIKYTDDNGHIAIKSIIEQDHIELLFIDDGVGIDSQDINHIFDYGYTGKNGRNSTKNASSGVGLYMVKQNIERLQHHIQVQSQVDSGTTIRIVF